MRAPIVATAFCLLATAASAQPASWPVEGPPRPLAAHDVNFPPYQIQTLPNGLQVVAVLHHEQPAVSMRLLVRAGSAFDPKGKTGLAHLEASLLDQGTTTKSATELNDTIDFIGGSMSAGAGSDLTYLNMIVMKDSFDTGLRTLSDMARHPAFAPAEIDRQRQQILSGLRVSFDDPEFIADAVFDRLVYGFHPYGLPQTGTPDTIASITRDDLAAFHDKFFVPNNAILAVVGDVTADEAFAAARRVFGDWERRDVAAGKFVDPPDPTRRVVIVNKPDAVQTEVRVGHIGIPRNHPDYMAINLAIRILGGEGSNRLHQILRTARGLTYGAQAEFDTLQESGDFEAQTNTRSEATGEVLRLIVDEFWRLQRERVGEHELEGAKAYLTGSFPLTIETPDAIAMQVLNVIFYGLPVEQLQTFRQRVNAVTADDIQRVAQKYLRPDRLSVVLVGNAAAFASQLQGIGFGTFETVDLDNLDLTAVDFKHAPARAGQAPAARAERARSGVAAYRTASQQGVVAEGGPTAKALLDRVIAAKGGLEKLRGLRNITVRQTITNETPNGTMTQEMSTYIAYPDRFRVESRSEGATFVQVFDGEHTWTRGPQGVEEVPPAAAAEAKATMRREVVSLLLAASNGSIHARLLPDVKTSDGRLQHALEFSNPDLNPIVLYVDPETLLITKETYVVARPGQPLIEELFSDYRGVDGIQIPFTAERRIGPITTRRRVTDIAINAQLDPALFKRPAS